MDSTAAVHFRAGIVLCSFFFFFPLPERECFPPRSWSLANSARDWEPARSRRFCFSASASQVPNSWAREVYQRVGSLEGGARYAAAEAALATKTVVVAGNVSYVHNTDPLNIRCFLLLLFFLRFVGFFGGWCADFVERGDEGGYFLYDRVS